MPTVNKTLDGGDLNYIKISPAEIYKSDDAKTAELLCAAEYNSAVTALQYAMFDDAALQFQNCLNTVPGDPRSLIGLYCVKINDNRLFDYFSGKRQFDVASTKAKKVSFIHELENIMLLINDETAIQNILDYIFHNGIDERDFNFAGISKPRIEYLLCYCLNEDNQMKFLKKYLSVCRAAAETEKCGAAFDIFTILTAYLPPENAELITRYTEEFADFLLQYGEFDKVRECMEFLLSQSLSYIVKAKYYNLLAALKCKNKEELLHCENFRSDTPAYVKLLKVTKKDHETHKKYEQLLTESLAVRELDKKERERIAAEEKAEREKAERVAADRKYQMRRDENDRRATKIFLVTAPIFIGLMTLLICLISSVKNPTVNMVSFCVTAVILIIGTVYTNKVSSRDCDKYLHKAAVSVFTFANFILPTVFAYTNYYSGGYIWFGVLALALSFIVTFFEAWAIPLGELEAIDAGYMLDSIVVSNIPITLGITAFVGFIRGGALWFNILLLALSVSAYVLLGLFGDYLGDLFDGTLSVITPAFFALLFAALSIFVISWSGIGILFGVLSIIMATASVIWTAINIVLIINA